MPRKTNKLVRDMEPSAVASMRPRPDAAENTTGAGTPAPAAPCFNEAAARCRGKLAALAASARTFRLPLQ